MDVIGALVILFAKPALIVISFVGCLLFALKCNMGFISMVLPICEESGWAYGPGHGDLLLLPFWLVLNSALWSIMCQIVLLYFTLGIYVGTVLIFATEELK